MNITVQYNMTGHTSEELVFVGCFQKEAKKGKETVKELQTGHWPKEWKEAFQKIPSSAHFKGDKNVNFMFNLENGLRIFALGLGDKSKYNDEILRRVIAKVFKDYEGKNKEISILLDSFLLGRDLEKTAYTIAEAIGMTHYSYDVHKKNKTKRILETIHLDTTEKKAKAGKLEIAVAEAKIVTDAITVCRDFVNDPPNILNSVTYSKLVVEDIKKVKGVKAKVLGRAEIKKEKMGMFLSVNAGSAHEPQLVHLTYTPPKATSKTKHVAMVGKGLTFDTGGYSMKPSSAINGMKFDMAGSATVYAAFRAAAMLQLPVKISCYLGITDNAINEKATLPDSIVQARNGLSVEILNTDAEGRLVLGDVINYACEEKPDALIDAATLTGAVLVSLGHEVCGIMGNNQKLVNELLKAANDTHEHMWQLPIIEEYRDDMKSSCADLQNIGNSRNAGTAKAAAFLEFFVKNDVAWAHLDIAGVANDQKQLPYCPRGASGQIIRTLVTYLRNVK
ncbi:MAG: leucyl aminopeptidase [Bdellovibrio sp. CG_4_9_14_3_um_filter_39_7]|nr:MAG: leucyl aminopeptidase [Bdellovibrio sp. CG_4_9_14_3_um_filter_39_7]